MQLRVISIDGAHRLGCADGGAEVCDVELVNEFLSHLVARCFSPATVRAYAYDLLSFLRFLSGRRATLADGRRTCSTIWTGSSSLRRRRGRGWSGWTVGAVPRRRR